MPYPIGILGGTFDPIHVGHLCMAQWAADALGLAKVWLLPAGQPPHKADRPVTSAFHRLRMTELACADNPRLQLCGYEIEKKTPSYTVETLEVLAPDFAEPPWFIIGLDALLNIKHWYCWERLIDYCRLAVLPRQHTWIHDAHTLQTWLESYLPSFQGHVHWLDLPPIDLSSSELRRVLRLGYDCRYCLHPAVWDYIQVEGLYREDSGG